MSYLSDLENLANAVATYSADLQRYLKNPPLSRDLQLSRKQLTIDRLRTCLKLRTLWYEKKELILNDEDLLSEEPRLPLEIPELIFNDENLLSEEPRLPLEIPEDEVEVGEYGATTMTLGSLIEKLTALKEKLGHNAPVWHAELGALEITTMVEIYKEGIIIA